MTPSKAVILVLAALALACALGARAAQGQCATVNKNINNAPVCFLAKRR